MRDGSVRGQGSAFDGGAARRAREALGMGPGDVAFGMRAAYGLDVAPGTVTAWEHGLAVPGERELTALAGALWCAPGDLLGEPRTLREHRLAQGLSAADLARAIGMDAAVYAHAEATGAWPGDARQTDALGRTLRLSIPAMVRLIGAEEELAGLLRRAVRSRWQPYVTRVGALVPLPRHYIEDGLHTLHEAYASLTSASLAWGRPAAGADTRDASRDFLAGILAHFWHTLDPGR